MTEETVFSDRPAELYGAIKKHSKKKNTTEEVPEVAYARTCYDKSCQAMMTLKLQFLVLQRDDTCLASLLKLNLIAASKIGAISSATSELKLFLTSSRFPSSRSSTAKQLQIGLCSLPPSLLVYLYNFLVLLLLFLHLPLVHKQPLVLVLKAETRTTAG